MSRMEIAVYRVSLVCGLRKHRIENNVLRFINFNIDEKKTNFKFL